MRIRKSTAGFEFAVHSVMRFYLNCITFFTLFCFSLSGCAKFEGETSVFTIDSQQVAENVSYEALAWESSTHPERKQWSFDLMNMVSENLASLDAAQDIESFCFRYYSLSHAEKVNVWAQIFSVMTYYESSWNPKSYSVDVGSADNPDTWSVGLLQLSVVDQKNYKFSFGYNFADLQDPIKNLRLGVAIMGRQIAKHGLILIPKGHAGLYWAVLHPGGKHDKSAVIQSRVQSLRICQ